MTSFYVRGFFPTFCEKSKLSRKGRAGARRMEPALIRPPSQNALGFANCPVYLLHADQEPEGEFNRKHRRKCPEQHVITPFPRPGFAINLAADSDIDPVSYHVRPRIADSGSGCSIGVVLGLAACYWGGGLRLGQGWPLLLACSPLPCHPPTQKRLSRCLSFPIRTTRSLTRNAQQRVRLTRMFR